MIAFYESRDERLFIGEMTKYPFPLHVHELAEIIGVTAAGAPREELMGAPDAPTRCTLSYDADAKRAVFTVCSAVSPISVNPAISALWRNPLL